MISGVGDDLLDFITKESSNRFIVELGKEFRINFQSAEEDTFPTLSDEDLEELKCTEINAILVGTQDQTQQHCKMFKEIFSQKKWSV